MKRYVARAIRKLAEERGVSVRLARRAHMDLPARQRGRFNGRFLEAWFDAANIMSKVQREFGSYRHWLGAK